MKTQLSPVVAVVVILIVVVVVALVIWKFSGKKNVGNTPEKAGMGMKAALKNAPAGTPGAGSGEPTAAPGDAGGGGSE